MRRLLLFLTGVVFACCAAGVSYGGSTAASELWVRDGALTRQGSGLLSEMLNAERRGLRPSDYHASQLELRARKLAGASASERAAFDAALTSSAKRLATDLHSGRVKPADVGYDLDVPRPSFDVAQAVNQLAAAVDVAAGLDALEPPLHHYALLKAALARYRALAARPALTALPPLPRARVREGDRYDGAPALHALLMALGDLPVQMPRVQPELDATLVAGLKSFQLRHGLDADGVLGRATFRALTTPFSARVQQIELSMERMRWLPAPLTAPPIIVNVPQFRLFAFRTPEDRAEEIQQMDVIVGEAFEGRRTPVFAADMKYVVLNPYWDVPRSILVKELLPDILRDPKWPDTHGYEIVLGDGDDARILPATPENVSLLQKGRARLRQKPGPTNALGRVKFMFPNRHNVYLHDTPARALFQRSRRAFSHGCIRVSDPMALLDHVMRNDPTWTDERRDSLLARGRPVRIALREPIRVFILYGTALAMESGSVMFFEDIYAQDAPLISRLATYNSATPYGVLRLPHSANGLENRRSFVGESPCAFCVKSPSAPSS